MVGQVAAVNAHRLHRDALGRQPMRQRYQLPGGCLGVVGVDQQRDRLRVRAGKVLKGLGLARMYLNEGVGHGAKQRDAPVQAGQHGGGAVKAGQVAGPRRQQAGLGAMGTAQPEIHQLQHRCHQPGARRLRCHQRLVLQQVDDAGLHQLRLRQGRHHAQHRFIGKKHRALGQGVHRALEAQQAQRLDEAAMEAPGARQPGQLGLAQAGAFQKIQHLLQPGRHQELALLG